MRGASVCVHERNASVGAQIKPADTLLKVCAAFISRVPKYCTGGSGGGGLVGV